MENFRSTLSTYAAAARLSAEPPVLEIGQFSCEDLGIPIFQSNERAEEWVYNINLRVCDEDMRERERERIQEESDECEDLEETDYHSVTMAAHENKLMRHIRTAQFLQQYQMCTEDPADRLMTWLMRLPFVPMMTMETHASGILHEEYPTEEEHELDLVVQNEIAGACLTSEQDKHMPPTTQTLSIEDATDSDDSEYDRY